MQKKTTNAFPGYVFAMGFFYHLLGIMLYWSALLTINGLEHKKYSYQFFFETLEKLVWESDSYFQILKENSYKMYHLYLIWGIIITAIFTVLIFLYQKKRGINDQKNNLLLCFLPLWCALVFYGCFFIL